MIETLKRGFSIQETKAELAPAFVHENGKNVIQ